MQKYCQDCGTLLVEKELENEGKIPYCPNCDKFHFPLYNVAVSMIVYNKKTDKILLIKQYGRPDYILVAGYVSRTEALENAVVREIKEEVGLDVQAIKFNRTHFFEPTNTLMCNFTAYVEDNQVSINQEVDDYHWFSKQAARENIKPNSLAAYFLNNYLDNEEKNDETISCRCFY